MNAGRFVVGMIGPGEAIVFDLPAPRNVNLQTAVSVAFSLTVNGQAIGPWAVVVSANSIRATYIPTGTEFTSGRAIMRPTLTVDGVPYRYRPIHEVIGDE